MENISDLIKSRGIERPIQPSKLLEWQGWALDFCKKFEIPAKEKGTIMKIAKVYQHKIEYLRGLSGYLSDYPNLKVGVGAVRLLLWKIKKDKEDGLSRRRTNFI